MGEHDEHEPSAAHREIIATMTIALDPVIAATQVEPDERQAFGIAAKQFMNDYRTELERHGIDWPPLPALVALEQFMRLEQDLDTWYPAAVATIRQYLTAARAQEASLN